VRNLGSRLRRAIKHLPLSPQPLPAVIDVVFLSAVAMKKVHATFMNDPELTDVITFHHGEILVCPYVAQEEASPHGHTLEEELLFYILHGLLHLLGWADTTPAQRRQMHREQTRLLHLS
jgi:probable rRNA maturation factor